MSKQGRLIGRRRGLLPLGAQRTPDNSQNLNIAQRLARDKDPLVVGVGFGRRHHVSGYVPCQQIVRQDSIEHFSIPEKHAYPDPFKLGPRQKNPAGFLLGFKIPNKANTLDFFIRQLNERPVGPQKFNGLWLQVAERIDKTRQTLPVEPADNDFLRG